MLKNISAESAKIKQEKGAVLNPKVELMSLNISLSSNIWNFCY